MSDEIHPVLSQRFNEALQFAATIHCAQTRKKTSVPYVSHLLAVVAIVLERGGSEDEAIAALLHDAAEDQGGRPMLAQIEVRFGKEVACIVEGCTDTFEDPKPDWLKRKQEYIEHLRTADASICLVAAADKLHNARQIVDDLRLHGAVVWERFTATRKETLWYYESVLKALRGRLPGGRNGIEWDLEEAVSRMHKWPNWG